MSETTVLNPPDVLTPPALVPPAPLTVIEPEKASGMVQVDAKVIPELDAQVEQFITDTLTLDKHSDGFKARVESIHRMGNADVINAASVSNRMLERPVRLMKDGLFSDGAGIGKSLIDLRRKVEELNPARQGDLFQPRKLLGFIPFGSKLEDYFDQYRSAQGHINSILSDLADGKDELLRDNAAIEQEKVALWDTMQRLEQYIYIGKQLDTKLSERITEIEAADPEKARVVKEELLFYTRQKVTDLLTQQAVSVQGYLALDMIRKNNLELAKGVDRASTTTISALRTAVMVAQALTNQKLVLEQVKALNSTTEDMIVATSELLKTQSAEIHQQASGSMISVDKLQQAFDNVFATMEMIADYKIKALDGMKQTVDALTGQVARAQKYLDQVREGEAREAARSAPGSEGVVRL
ncbi:MAG: toxic anion resistance protein [Pseudomonadota bacterium]